MLHTPVFQISPPEPETSSETSGGPVGLRTGAQCCMMELTSTRLTSLSKLLGSSFFSLLCLSCQEKLAPQRDDGAHRASLHGASLAIGRCVPSSHLCPPPADQLSAPPLTGVLETRHIPQRLTQPQAGLGLVSAPKDQGQLIPKPDGLSQGTLQRAQQNE